MGRQVEVELNPTEMMQGALIGVMRQVQNIKYSRSNAYGAGDKNGWQLHIEGALGELALAKYLGKYYGGIGKLRGTDVDGVDVRTRSRHDYDLILHPDDPDERWFWLLTGGNGQYTVRGKILGKDGKREEWWKDPAGGRPAFFVPQDALELTLPIDH